jgi:hypothetical protein
MVAMTTATDPAAADGPGGRFDRPVLVSNLLSGAVWLAVPTLTGAWAVTVVGLAYVVPAAFFLSWAHAGGIGSGRRRTTVWLVVWLAAVLLWGVLTASLEFTGSSGDYVAGVTGGLLFGTVSVLAWQVVALAVRRFQAWQAGATRT